MSERARKCYTLSVRLLVGFYSKTPYKINENNNMGILQMSHKVSQAFLKKMT